MAYVEINNFYLLFRCFTHVCIDTYVSRYFYKNINMILFLLYELKKKPFFC